MNTCQEVSKRQREDVNIGNVPHVTVPQYGERKHPVSGEPDQKNQEEHDRHDISFRPIFIRHVLFSHVQLFLILFQHHLIDRIIRGRGNRGSDSEDRQGGRGCP